MNSKIIFGHGIVAPILKGSKPKSAEEKADFEEFLVVSRDLARKQVYEFMGTEMVLSHNKKLPIGKITELSIEEKFVDDKWRSFLCCSFKIDNQIFIGALQKMGRKLAKSSDKKQTSKAISVDGFVLEATDPAVSVTDLENARYFFSAYTFFWDRFCALSASYDKMFGDLREISLVVTGRRNFSVITSLQYCRQDLGAVNDYSNTSEKAFYEEIVGTYSLSRIIREGQKTAQELTTIENPSMKFRMNFKKT